MRIIKATQTQRTINELMDQKNISLRKLARLIGVSASMLSRLINSKRTFLHKHKINISKVLGVEESEIQWPVKK
nr:transcriptional regulator [uncultured Mediterranean phage uvMED]